MKSFLRMTDIFGKKPELRIGDYYSYKTKFGGFLTIIVIIMIFFLTIYFGLQVINKEKPNIVFSVLSTQDPPLTYVSQQNLSFAFGMENPITFDQFFDETIYQAKGYFLLGERVVRSNSSGFEWKINEIELSRCSLDHFPGRFSSIYKNFPLNLMYCIKNPEQSFPLNGSFAGHYYTYFKFEIFQCKNKTSNITCKTQQEIDAALDGAFFEFSYTDNSIDPMNITYPNQVFAGDSFNTVSNKYYTEFIHNLNTININSDEGLVFENLNFKEFLSTNQIKIMNNFQPNPSVYVTYLVQLSSNIYTYKRNYMKVQDVAAQIGGMINFLYFSVNILVYFFNETYFIEKLCNSLYVFKEANSINDNQNLKRILMEDMNSTFKKISDNTKNSIGIRPFRPAELKESISCYFKEKMNEKKIKYRMSEVSKYIFCGICIFKENKKFNFLINAYMHHVHKKLEITRILGLLEEFEKLKYLIFDVDQLILFHNSPKQEVVDYDLKNSSLDKSTNISHLYNQIEKTKNVSQVDVETSYSKILEKLILGENTVNLKLTKLFQTYS